MKKTALLLLLAAALPLQADEEETTKFREALRDSMLRLRDAQNQLANAQAAQFAAEAKAAELEEKTKSLAKELADERNTSTNLIAGLNKELAGRDAKIASLEATLAKWKKSYGEVAKLASKREGQRQKLDAEKLSLERKVEEHQFKNIEMYKAGMEILDRYEKFGLGDALLAREPFTAAQRVKFQNLVQDFADQLVEARIPADQPNKN
ncbi:MAG: phage major capsid protein [Verrucomicrobia bacterium]|nr:phage major capsid protein [Verrucomicrobiota bacterium]